VTATGCWGSNRLTSLTTPGKKNTVSSSPGDRSQEMIFVSSPIDTVLDHAEQPGSMSP